MVDWVSCDAEEGQRECADKVRGFLAAGYGRPVDEEPQRARTQDEPRGAAGSRAGGVVADAGAGAFWADGAAGGDGDDGADGDGGVGVGDVAEGGRQGWAGGDGGVVGGGAAGAVAEAAAAVV